MTCDGRCCAVFALRNSYEDYQERPEAIPEGHFIADMLIPLTHEQAMDRSAAFDIHWPAREEQGEHYFTCKHWDEHTRLCGVYENRPDMCRGYPYEQECTHGCGECGGLSLKALAEAREESLVALVPLASLVPPECGP